MAISVVQVTATGSNFGSAGSMTAAFGSSVTAGNTIVLFLTSDDVGGNIGTLSDTLGTTYTVRKTFAPSGAYMAVYSGVAPSSGANTVAMSTGGGDYFVMMAYELNTTAGTIAYEGASTLTAELTASPITTNSLTTTHANCALFGFYLDNNGTGPTSWTAGSGWSNLASNVSNSVNYCNAACEAKMVTSTGAYTAVITETLASGSPKTAGAIISFSDGVGSAPSAAGQFFALL